MSPVVLVRAAFLASVTLGLLTTAAFGAVSDEQVQQLIDRIDAQERRIAELEQALQKYAAPTAAATPAGSTRPAASGLERSKFQGDLRLRQENIDAEGASAVSRQRVRARAAVTTRIDDHVEMGLGLSTGGDNPTSADFTLGEGFSRKDIDLDLAYVDWNPVPDMHLTGGKMRNPFHRPGGNGLIWDGDLRPEGGSIRWDNGRFFASGAGFTPSVKASGSNSWIFGAQLGSRMQFSDALVLTLGASYFDLGDVEGQPLFYRPDNSYGNTVSTNPDGDLVYANGYREAEAFAELALRAGTLPLSLFVNYVNNTAADDLNTGWAAGFMLGDAARQGSWAVSYVYEDLEADAVLGLFTDSTFGGGGTDAYGHTFGGTYALTDRTNLQVAYFINWTGESVGVARRYDRLQLDINFRY